jgi:hypothetical protein
MSQESVINSGKEKKGNSKKHPRDDDEEEDDDSTPKFFYDTAAMMAVWNRRFPADAISFAHVQGKGTLFTCDICKATRRVNGDSPTFGTVKRHVDSNSHKDHWKEYRRARGYQEEEPVEDDDDAPPAKAANTNDVPRVPSPSPPPSDAASSLDVEDNNNVFALHHLHSQPIIGQIIDFARIGWLFKTYLEHEFPK